MTDVPDDLYAVLGLTRGASQDQISAAFRSQLRRYHPDTRTAGTSSRDAASDAVLQQVLTAYGVLRDPVLRAAYDDAYDHAHVKRTASRPSAPSSRARPVRVSRTPPIEDPPLRVGPVHWTPAR